MTPEEWFAATDPDALLVVVDPQLLANGIWQAPPRPSLVYRRLRLFATGCARMVWQLLPADARSAVLISERYADGRATDADLVTATIRLTFGPVSATQHAMNAAGNASLGDYRNDRYPNEPIHPMLRPREAARSAAYALATQTAGRVPARRSDAALWHDVWTESFEEARAIQAALLRDIFPPPGYTPHLEPQWCTSTVVAMARQIDATGDYSAMPILADALEDAGCEAEPVLQCSRAPARFHTRGNWVVDLVLERL